MPAAESLTAIGSLFSSLVVVVGALAAVRQLRHLRASNEVAALQAIMEQVERPEVEASLQFIQQDLVGKLHDPQFAADLAANPVAGEARRLLHGLNMWESVGMFVLLGSVSKRAIMLEYAWPIVNTWRAAAPAIAVIRRAQGETCGEMFEHLAVLATRWLETGHAAEARKLLRMPAAEPPPGVLDGDAAEGR
jgi:hypothetical protein